MNLLKNRMLNPKQLYDEDVVKMPTDHRFTWTYLVCFADREGRFEDKPFTVKLALFPFHETDVNLILQDFHDKNLIKRYSVNGRKYIQIKNFTTYQRPYTNEAQSKIPGPEHENQNQNQSLDMSEHAVTSRRKALVMGNDLREMCNSNVNNVSGYDEEHFNLLKQKLFLTEDELSLIQNLPFNKTSWDITKDAWSKEGLWQDDSGVPENVNSSKRMFDAAINSYNWHEFIIGLTRAISLSSRKNRKYLGVLSNFIKNKKWEEYIVPVKKEVLPEIDRSKNVLNFEGL